MKYNILAIRDVKVGFDIYSHQTQSTCQRWWSLCRTDCLEVADDEEHGYHLADDEEHGYQYAM